MSTRNPVAVVVFTPGRQVALIWLDDRLPDRLDALNEAEEAGGGAVAAVYETEEGEYTVGVYEEYSTDALVLAALDKLRRIERPN